MDSNRKTSSGVYARLFADRDKRMARVRTQLNLAQCARNKSEVIRLQAELKRLGCSLV